MTDIPKVPEKIKCPECGKSVGTVNLGMGGYLKYHRIRGNERCPGVDSPVKWQYEITEVKVENPLKKGGHLLYNFSFGETHEDSFRAVKVKMKIIGVGIGYKGTFYDFEGKIKDNDNQT